MTTGNKKPRTKLVAEKRAVPQKRKKKKTAPKQPRQRSLLRRIVMFPFRVIWAVFWRLGLVVSIITALGVAYIYSTLPEISGLVDGRARGSVTLLDKDGKVFAWRGDQFGGTIYAETVSPHLKNAVIATEDRRLYWHVGVDPIGIASAIRINLRAGRGPLSGNGGSTITQQTAKLLCLGVKYDKARWKTETEYERDCRRTTIWRKVKEATYALALEAKYTKDEILTIYMNRVFLGAGARGFEAASQRYFGISAAQVNIAQSAMLAGLLKAPSVYAPTNNLKRSQDRAQVIVGLMQNQGYITEGEAIIALQRPAALSKAAAARAGGYFADWVMSAGPDYFTRTTTEDVIIRTTFDPKMQIAAENAVTQIFTDRVSPSSKAQTAVVVMAPDGAVLAMVGGRTTQIPGAFNRATQANRQTGSTFKTFVYASALELGYSPNSIVRDEPLTIDVAGSGPWTPKNYSREYLGDVTLTQALAKSLNIPAVKISEAIGRDVVKQVAHDFGMKGPLAPGPALALGASESTLLEMTGAYAGILNGGSSVAPYGLVDLRFQGDSEALVGKSGGIGERVISKRASLLLTYMMHMAIETGSGARAKLPNRESAGKTGTTQSAKDAWFVGFSADYVVGVWMGNDDNTPLRGVTGSTLPAEIWRLTMEAAHEGVPAKPLPMARNIPDVQVPEPTAPSETRPQNTFSDFLQGIFGG